MTNLDIIGLNSSFIGYSLAEWIKKDSGHNLNTIPIKVQLFTDIKQNSKIQLTLQGILRNQQL